MPKIFYQNQNIMMRGKCNCGKKATSEWLVANYRSKTCYTLKFCDKCRPKYKTESMQLIYGK
jgi:hypothetical protein